MSLTLTLKDNGGNPVSGEGTSITLNGTTESSFTKFDLYGDTEQQTYSGKNLLNIPDGTYTRNGVTIVVLNGVMTFSGICNGGSDWYITLGSDATVPANTAYTRSESREGGVRLSTNLATSGAAWRYNIGYNGAPTTASMTESTTFHYIVVSIANGTDYSGGVLKPMLEVGSTATSFEPYVGGTASPNPDYPQEVQTVTGEQTITVSNGTESQEYPINLGKNLFDKDTITSGYYIDSSGNLVEDSSNFVGDYISINSTETYVVSASTTNAKRIGYYDSSKTFISRQLGSASSVELEIPNNAKYVRISCYNVDLDTLQCERGSTATTYAPYFTPIELCKIGDYQDYIYKSGSDWYVKKNIGKNVYNGSESWGVASTNPNMYYLANGVSPAVTEYPSGYSNYFTVVTRYPNQHLGELAIRGTNKTDLMIRYDTMADTTALTTWLGTHNTSLYYPLATPTDTQITNADLIAQLEALYNTAHSYNGQTIITSSSQYLPAIMDVTVGSSINEVMYTETELSNPLTITDIEGKSQNTTLNGNIYVDYVYNKKSFSVSIFNLKASDYATIRGFYDRQFTLNEFPLLSIPELNISEMPVFFEIGSREINSQCIVTDKLTLKFRETAQQ